MELVKEIARNVVVIVFFATVLEMLLPPKSSMGRYIQLIMGLFVIVSILSPTMNWLNKSSDIQSIALFPNETAMGQQNIFDDGMRIKKENEELAVQSAVAKMSKQIEALAKLVPGVEGAAVEISLDHDFVENGIINLVKIEAFSRPMNNESTLEPVKVELKEKMEQPIPTENPQKLQTRLKETICNFYGLRPEQVEVQLKQ